MLRAGVLLVIATSAQAVAWDALRGELYRFVARRVPGPDADDIVQESLLRIHRGLATVREDGALVGWMYQVTRNALADHLRASRPTDELEDEDLVEPIDPDDSAFASLTRCVAPFVGMLPAHYREAVELVELRGVSQVQAAAQLGIPVSTMKSRVQRGRAQLRELLDACCAIDLDARGHVVEVTPRCRCAAAPATT
ncbi:MAG TPA: sigma-70 family RNA polymerase sigma factor [Kofleriaceae bacterium]|nr:sigma-70 family RNA polymerase sigma factor [Kofleriaceae bacterium]